MQLTERFEDALQYAAYLHRAQRRKGTDTPYIGHLLGVTSIVLEAGGSEDEAIAALLHDAVEDQGGSLILAAIHERFGANVAEIVLGCTDAETFPKPPWRSRKEAYIEHLATARESVLLVSSADKLYNARAILADYRVHGAQVWERFTGRRDGTLWYYQSLVEAYRRRLQSPIVQELTHVVETLVAAARPEYLEEAAPAQ